MEIADVFVVNKADRPGADRIRQELEVAIALRAGQHYRHVAAHHGVSLKAAGAVERPEGRRAAATAVAAPPWEPEVVATVAAKGEGVDGLVESLGRHFAHLEATGSLAERRRRRLETRTKEVVDRAVQRWLWSGDGEVRTALGEVLAGHQTPYDAAAAVIARLGGSVAHERG
jgi:LAO/AO transport system kinase